MIERETIPCETCGKPTVYTGTRRCNNCWEVEGRLPTYMQSPGGQDFVREHLPKLDDRKDGHADAWDYEAVLRENNVSVEWCDKLTSDGVTFTEAPPDLCGWTFCWKHGSIHIGRTTEPIARKAAALFVSLWLRGVSASFWGPVGSLERGSKAPPGIFYRVRREVLGTTPPPLLLPVSIIATCSVARQRSWGCDTHWRFFDAYSFCDKLMDGFIVYLERQEQKAHHPV
jgi:hypothetical protein